MSNETVNMNIEEPVAAANVAIKAHKQQVDATDVVESVEDAVTDLMTDFICCRG